MKYIQKGESPSEFEGWKEKFRERTGKCPAYADLKGLVKKHLKEALLDEQGHICCYCMSRIDLYDSHIEHFIARSEAKVRPYSVAVQDVDLNYENMFLSCEGEYTHGNWDGTHCGRVKDNTAHDMLVCPTDPSVEGQFSYSIKGEINGLSPEAMTSIRVLNLDSLALNRHRRKAIFMSGLFDSDADYDFLIEKYKTPEEGIYAPFCQTILYILEKINSRDTKERK